MPQFPNVRQPALGIQDAAMLPAQAAGNLIQRLAAAEAAFVPTTKTFDSATSTTTLNATSASSGSGSLRSLLMPMSNDGFVPIVPNPSPAFYNGPQYAQFGNQALINAIVAGQTAAGSMCGRAVFGACGVQLPGPGYGPCGCQCVRELSEETVIDEGNSNGIIDEASEMVMRGSAAPATQAVPAVATPAVVETAAVATVPEVQPTVTQATAPDAENPAPTANIQYVTYNA